GKPTMHAILYRLQRWASGWLRGTCPPSRRRLVPRRPTLEPLELRAAPSGLSTDSLATPPGLQDRSAQDRSPSGTSSATASTSATALALMTPANSSPSQPP